MRSTTTVRLTLESDSKKNPLKKKSNRKFEVWVWLKFVQKFSIFGGFERSTEDLKMDF